MFTTNTGIKRSFYNQTGNFQFSFDLSVDSLFGGLNVGVSGGSNKINYFCNSGKIIDNNSRFVGVYYAGEPFSISGNVTSGSYDYFINNYPVAYGTAKQTGSYNYFYIKPIGVNCEYNCLINGGQPSLSINNINCFSGDAAGVGYIVNNNLPITIYSGEFTNFSDNLPFSFSDIFTGNLNRLQSGAFYVYPGENSVGFYTGNLQLITNAGPLNYLTTINITGSPAQPAYSFNLNGLSTIYKNTSQNYTSNIECPSGSGIPIVVSLEYVFGSGSYYTDIPVISGYYGTITGYIVNSGLLTKWVTGIGTGQGGQLNLTTTGLVNGLISSGFYSTGLFTWPQNILVTGWASGVGYTGLGTGLYIGKITGSIFYPSGTYLVNDYFTGNKTPLIRTGGTLSVVTIGNVTGFIDNIYSGSGYYTGINNLYGYATGSGNVLDYKKEFTGVWNILTGSSFNQVDYYNVGFYNATKTKYSNENTPVYYIDSTAFISVVYNNPWDAFPDSARLAVSGLNFNTGLTIEITGNYYV